MRNIGTSINPSTGTRSQGITRFLLLLLPLLAAAACEFDGAVNVSAEKLHGMLASDKTVVVVDTRSEREYRDGHIPGATLIPEEKVRIADRFLPPEKDTTIVFYCRGSG